MHLRYCCVPVLLPLSLHLDTSVEKAGAQRTAPLPIHPHWSSLGNTGSWGPCSCQLARSPGVLGCWLPKHSFFTGARHLVQRVTVPSSVPSCASMLLGITCLSIIRSRFLKFALAPLPAVGMLSAAGRQAMSGQAATSHLSCLWLLAPPRLLPLNGHGDLSASP